jgi:ribonuclease BN (tRNA processing enzyme)
MTARLTVTFAGSGDAFGSGGRLQACYHIQAADQPPVLVDCGATSLSALKRLGLSPSEISTVLISHLHGDHFAGLPFLVLDGQFSGRRVPLAVAGPEGISERLNDAMELMFPGSTAVRRRFDVEITELQPGTTATIGGLEVESWKVDHPSGAPPLAFRLRIGGRTVSYTGDTAWTDVIVDVASGADLFIAEAYYREKEIPYHLQLIDLVRNRHRLNAQRIVLTHMSSDMLAQKVTEFEVAHDGYVIHI